MISQMSNEQLCIAALDGDTEARNALVENNLRFIKRTAYEMWSAQQELNAALGLEINDLVQEGSLGLLDCIPGYNPDTGTFGYFFLSSLRKARLTGSPSLRPHRGQISSITPVYPHTGSRSTGWFTEP